MHEKDIIHENGDFFVLKVKDIYEVRRNAGSVSVGDSGYLDASIAIARCDYLAKRTAR